ncbi:MAG: hypothetical protein KGL53_07160 [Elusimicrobia bacterium]|nr:hypothetical protein [Elusimicrobiota bacterium]
MIRRDWFKRHVEVLAQCLGTVLGLRKKGEVQEAAAVLETSLQKAFGLGAPLCLGLPLEEFLRLACRGVPPSAEFLETLSGVFAAWGELFAAQARPEDAAAAQARADELAAMARSIAKPANPL